VQKTPTRAVASISRVFACRAFVAAFVISGEACHQLLSVCVVARLDFRDEAGGVCAAQCGGEFAAM